MRQRLSLEPLESRLLLAAGPRLMENLNRGVVATRSSTTGVFVSWRSLTQDASSTAFNLYRSANGGGVTKLNASPLTGGTNFSDNSANLAAANTYYVRPVVGGVEQAPSKPYTLRANATVEPLFSIPLRPITSNPDDYHVEFTWVGDLDGDGGYDFIVDRVSWEAGMTEFVEAYKQDGTLLWSYDAGPNSLNRYNIEPGSSALGVGNWDGMTVYDLNSDGRAEVMIRTANGVVFGDGKTLSYPADDNIQFVSVLDGMTGAEKARLQVHTDYLADGPMAASMGIGYLDGVHPSLVIKMKNRVGNGGFNEMIVAYDYDGALTQKWKWNRTGGNFPDGHQIRIVDVDQNGTDEIVEIGFVLNGDGTVKYSLGPQGIIHGDRFHIGDFDPDRPGLEGYGVQQNNPSMLHEYYYDAGTGEVLHRRIGTSVADIGRGVAMDIDPSHRGYEYWAFSGIHNSKTPVVGQAPVETRLTNEPNRPWPNFGIWWDGDVLAENLNNTVIDKWNPASQSVGRVSTLYRNGAIEVSGEAPTFYGDIIGDWREEVIYEHWDRTKLLIYTTQIASSTRLYSLAQNPYYRNGLTIKGYQQSNHVDYYLGSGMTPPPPPNIHVLDFGSNAAPTVAAPAAASPNAVAGTTTNLSVLGADDGGEANLAYAWAATGPAAVAYSANGTDAAKNTTVTFSTAGTYTFIATIRDAAGRTATSSVNVTVSQTVSSVTVSPNSANVAPNGTQQFTVSGKDQFGGEMSTLPTFTWIVISGEGTIDSSGLYTAPATPGSATIRAAHGAVSGTASVTIANTLVWYQTDISSGTTLPDSSGNNFTANLSGAYSFVPGVSGNAVRFSGAGGAASLPTGVVSTLNDEFTIATWVNPASLGTSDNWERIFDFGTGGTTPSIYMFMTTRASTGRPRFAITTSGGAGEQVVDASVALTAGQWNHVAITLSGTSATLYVNGVARGTGNVTLRPSTLGNTTHNFIGDSQFAADPPFLGSIDDFRIYGRALSPTEMKALAGGTVAGRVFHDINASGGYDAGEPTLNGVQVYLDANNNSTLDGDELITTTSGAGSYAVSNVPAGSYIVREVVAPTDFVCANAPAVTVSAAAAVSADLANARIVYAGTGSGDMYTLLKSAAGKYEILISKTLAYTVFGGAPSLTFNLGDGDDTLVIDLVNGAPSPSGGVTFDGGSASDGISVIGTAGAQAIAFDESDVAVAGGHISHDNLESATFDGYGGWDSITINGGPAITFAAAQQLQALEMTGAAAARFASGATMASVARGISLAGDSTLDLADATLVIDTTDPAAIGKFDGSAYSGYLGLVASAHNSSAWDGLGIRTTMQDARDGLATIAVATAEIALGLGASDTVIFEGQTVSGRSVILKYTYAGDTNFDGKLDADDYGTIDFSVLLPGPIDGYYNGDFNYDGVVNADDYGVIDFNILAQGSPL